MHTDADGGDASIDNFIIAYNHIVRDLQADPNLLNTVVWVMNSLRLDINDIGNIMYIRRIINMFGNTSLYDILISISNLVSERSGLDLTTAFAPLRDLQSHIGLLTDALRIRAQILYTPVSAVSQGRVLPENFARPILVSPTVNHSTLAPFSSTLKPTSSSAATSLMTEMPTVVDKNSLFFYFFRILILSGVCIGTYFICKNLLTSNLIEICDTNATDIISSDFILDWLALDYRAIYFTILLFILFFLINIYIIKILCRFKSYKQ
jgi:hypothetical protein